MRTTSILSFFLVWLAAASAFVLAPGRPLLTTRLSASTKEADLSPELQAAIAQVRKCASNFSEETTHFANVWIENMLAGTPSATPAGLLEECVLDDQACNCQEFDAALKTLDSLLGVGSGEQY